MKVCDVVQFFSPLGGGVRRYIEDKSRYFAQRPDIDHIIIIPSDQNAVEYRHRSKIFHIQSLRLLGSISYRMLLNQKRILGILQSERPDIIEVGDPYRSAWIALHAGRELGVPVVAYYHSDFPRALGRTIRRFCGSSVETLLSAPINRYIVKLYTSMDATVVASERLKLILNETGIDNVVRIPLGTDVETFKYNPNGRRIRNELGLSDDDFLIVFVGRLAREKNIRCLIRMMTELEANPGGAGRCHLMLVGDGEKRRVVERHLKRMSNVSWFRYCTQAEQLTAYYSAADLFVHAGAFETFGLTALEAQACGTRAVVVEGGGMDDVVTCETPRILSKSPQPADLADAVRRARALSSDSSREERRRRVVERFSIDATIERLVGLYSHLIKGGSTADFVDPIDKKHPSEPHADLDQTLLAR